MFHVKSKVFVPVSIQTRMIKDNDENNKTHIKRENWQERRNKEDEEEETKL